jgi:hypothetical protein
MSLFVLSVAKNAVAKLSRHDLANVAKNAIVTSLCLCRNIEEVGEKLL